MVIRFYIGEGVFHFGLPFGIRLKGPAWCYLSLGVNFQQLFGNFDDGFFGPTFEGVPIHATQPVKQGGMVINPNITGQPVSLMNGHIEFVGIGVLNGQIFPLYAFKIQFNQANVTAYAMFNMNY